MDEEMYHKRSKNELTPSFLNTYVNKPPPRDMDSPRSPSTVQSFPSPRGPMSPCAIHP